MSEYLSRTWHSAWHRVTITYKKYQNYSVLLLILSSKLLLVNIQIPPLPSDPSIFARVTNLAGGRVTYLCGLVNL